MSAGLTRFGAKSCPSAVGTHGALAAAGPGRSASVATIDDLLVAVVGTPRFEAADLRNCAEAQSAARALGTAFRRSGRDAFAAIHGHFSAAIIDDRTGSAILAVDRTGVHALRYLAHDTGLLFASNATCIQHHPLARLAIDSQALYDYVYFHAIPGPRTIFRDLKRLMPGQWVTYADRRCDVGHYWRMRFEERGSSHNMEELRGELLGTLQRAVERTVGSGQSVGAFLSGGTDSSTVAGMLGQATGEPARTYSIGFEAPGYDEIEYARITAKHFGTRHHEYYVTADDIVRAVPGIAEIHDEPFGNSSAVPTFCCAELARKDGITCLLAGDGGDELFGGNERYAKQYVFSLYEKVPSWLRSSVIGPLLSNDALVDALAPLRKARSYVQQASLPMPARLQTYNLVERLGAHRIFAKDFLDSIALRAPLDHLTAVYNATGANSQINCMLGLDLQLTLADNDLPKVSRSCELAGMDVAYPLLDDEVVAFSARLAPELKLKGTRLRYFFKESLRGFLPAATITKKKHGFGLPFGLWLDSHRNLSALANDSLSDLRNRGIIRPAFLDELTGQRVSEHASYYGSLVWVLMMLEQWFKTHIDRKYADLSARTAARA
jgi:asparagine synthase (glutamine-hydrolysing)